jgi:hypothetical protein
MRWNRVTGCAGIATVLLAFLEVFGPSFPSTGDSAAAIDAHFVSHRTWMLSAVAVQGIGDVLWLVFLGGLGTVIWARGSAASAATAVLGGALNTAISLTGLAGIATTAYIVAGGGNPELAKTLFTMSAMTLVLSNFPLALMAAAAAAAPLPRWFRLASAATTIVFLAGGGALARSGAFAPDGAVQFLTYGLELLWTAAASVLLLRAVSPTASPGNR